MVSGGIFTILFTVGASLSFSIAAIVLGSVLVAHAVFAGARDHKTTIFSVKILGRATRSEEQ